MIVCVSPTPAVDRLHQVSGPVVVGEIHRPTRVVAVAGGKGLNAARAAAALGAHVRAVAPLGGGSGAWIEAELAAAGIEVRSVRTQAEPRVCVSVAGEGQELTEFYEGAPELLADEWDALVEVVRAAADGAGWVTLSGSLPPGSPADGMATLIGAAREAGARVALDARDDDLRAGVLGEPDLIKINEHEARDLLGSTDVAALCPPGGVACITRGADGLELATDGVRLRARPPVRGRYPVGCGDVTLGALVTARDAGADWHEAVALAVGAAAAAAEVPGAGVLDPARARMLAADVEVSAIRS
ncbi:1-phosphofructokinase [Solirubrobacter sp. CPCC 204708]|uniref:PfkB family carbohydrate kinase n=1 Tax=Solirubrobacter deserti TaxID=2282478 RepID=A0ABT4RFJ8_9ACTN|nr:PfkB family carbohydrate kinase [Solirubrobacter deserti]MBE2319417.1 1-phosphofructokinase [Solirubrobacter deserti]MDA0137298.1 PfkB family carbohydrate kinase [Solirubrobacter deserti]